MTKDVATRDPKTGKFLKGVSGNPLGRPIGSKNKVNILKISMEEAFREDHFDKIQKILASVVEDALEGDKSARKLIWDACVSKANLTEDKDQRGEVPQIIIKHMDVNPPKGETIDVDNYEVEE